MRKRFAVAFIGAVLLVGLLGGVAAAATPIMTFDVLIGDHCVSGMGKPDTALRVVVRDVDGIVQGRGITQVYSDGFWEFCEIYGAVRPGYTITATLYTPQGTIAKRTVTVPQISIRLDRDADLAFGRGPAGESVTIYASDYRFDHWGESYATSMPVIVDGTGAWSYDLGADGINVRGGADARIEWTNASGTVHVYRYGAAPFLSVVLGMPEFWGATRMLGHASVTLTNGPTVVATGHAVGDILSGSFFGLLSDSEGELFNLQPGSHLWATGIGNGFDWTVPDAVTSVSKSSDRVNGRCFPNSRFRVSVSDKDYWTSATKFGTVAANGLFSRDFTSLMNIARGYRVVVECWTEPGDSVAEVYLVP